MRNVYSELGSPVRYKFDALSEHLAPQERSARSAREGRAGAQVVGRIVKETQVSSDNGGLDRSVREAVLRCVPS